MSDAIDFHLELRQMWRERLCDANKRLAAAGTDKATAERELDAIDGYIARELLAEAAELVPCTALPESFLALAAEPVPVLAGFIQTGATQ